MIARPAHHLMRLPARCRDPQHSLRSAPSAASTCCRMRYQASMLKEWTRPIVLAGRLDAASSTESLSQQHCNLSCVLDARSADLTCPRYCRARPAASAATSRERSAAPAAQMRRSCRSRFPLLPTHRRRRGSAAQPQTGWASAICTFQCPMSHAISSQRVYTDHCFDTNHCVCTDHASMRIRRKVVVCTAGTVAHVQPISSTAVMSSGSTPTSSNADMLVEWAQLPAAAHLCHLAVSGNMYERQFALQCL